MATKKERYWMAVYAETREEQLLVQAVIDALREGHLHALVGSALRKPHPGIDREVDWDICDDD